MSLLDAILLGIIQGLTEFLPISSTAHLVIAGKLFGLVDHARPEQWTAFMAVIQIGTMAAVVLYFARDLWGIARDFLVDGARYLVSPRRGPGRARMGWFIVLGTLPVVVVGLAFKDAIEGHLTKSYAVIGSSLIGLALLLWLAEAVSKHRKTIAQATWLDALLVGVAQACALIPGSSRSGTTITAGLFVGLKRDDAARFSFLLSVPAVLASGLFELYETRELIGDLGALNVVVAMLVSGLVGFAAIAFLLRYLRTHSTAIFIGYRLVLGAVLWGAVLTGAR